MAMKKRKFITKREVPRPTHHPSPPKIIIIIIIINKNLS